MKPPRSGWTVARLVHTSHVGWSWEIAREGLVVLQSAESFQNPATCARDAERWRADLAAGRVVLDDQGYPVQA